LLRNGAKFIVCFFDQNYPYNWPKANQDVESIYKALLNKVITDFDFGLIAKPKRNINFFGAMSDLSKLVKDARETGRCLFLDRDIFTNSAAQAADLVVGFSIHSTPAFEAALSGIPIIICDLQKFTHHPFYKENLGKIVFNDPGEMMDVIEKLKDRKVNYNELGDLTPILNKIDPFRDKRASERIGYFMKWILDGFDGGNNRGQAIAKASEKYRIQWGTDKVITF
jgi:hypothetical protein